MSDAYCKNLVSAVAVPWTFVLADDNGDDNDKDYYVDDNSNMLPQWHMWESQVKNLKVR